MRCKLRDICLIEKKSITPETDKWYYLYSLPAFDNSKTPEKVMGDSIKSGKFVVEPNTILFNKLNVRFRRVWNINFQPLPNSICSTEFIPLRPKNCDQSYLYYVLISNELTRTMESQRTGTSSSHQRIHPDSLLDYEIDLPPLDEQRAIGATLSAIDSKITINGMINQRLEQIAQAIFKSWFVDFEPFGGEMPGDWREGTFSEIILSTVGGDWGKDKPEGNYIKEVYCIRGADIPDVTLGNKGKMPIRYILPKNFAQKRLMVGDIVVEISGGSPTQSTGRCALITQAFLNRFDREMVCTNFCRAIKPLAEYSTFVYFYLKYLYSQNVMFTYENGTTGIKNLDISGLLETEPVIIPPLDVAVLYANTVSALIDTIISNGLENETLAAIRDTLLPRLMSGELSVADLKDIT